MLKRKSALSVIETFTAATAHLAADAAVKAAGRYSLSRYVSQEVAKAERACYSYGDKLQMSARRVKAGAAIAERGRAYKKRSYRQIHIPICGRQ